MRLLTLTKLGDLITFSGHPFQTVSISRCVCSADVSAYRSSISTNVIVTSDGNVTWLSMVIFRSSCAVDVRYFPFDEQNCTMVFASWTYDGFQLNLVKVLRLLSQQATDRMVVSFMPNTHRRHYETVELRRVGVGGVYMNSQLAHDDCRRIRRCERNRWR